MAESKKPLVYKIVGFFITLINIIFIFLFCFGYSNIDCDSSFGDELSRYMVDNNLTDYKPKISNVCPTISEGNNFTHGIILAIIVLLAIGYGILLIINYTYFLCYLISKNKNLINISIFFYIAQIVMSIMSIAFGFSSNNVLPDKIFEDFGELRGKLRNLYDDFLGKIIYLKIGSIFFLITSVFGMVAELIIDYYVQKQDVERQPLLENENVGLIDDFSDNVIK